MLQQPNAMHIYAIEEYSNPMLSLAVEPKTRWLNNLMSNAIVWSIGAVSVTSNDLSIYQMHECVAQSDSKRLYVIWTFVLCVFAVYKLKKTKTTMIKQLVCDEHVYNIIAHRNRVFGIRYFNSLNRFFMAFYNVIVRWLGFLFYFVDSFGFVFC